MIGEQYVKYLFELNKNNSGLILSLIWVIHIVHLYLQSLEHFQFAFLHLQEEQLDEQVHFTSRLITSLATGYVNHFGTSLPSLSNQPR